MIAIVCRFNCEYLCMKTGLQWLLIGISAVLFFNLARSVSDLLSRRNLVRQEEEKLNEAQNEYSELTAQLQEATSAGFIEREARNRLNLARESEVIVIIPSPVPPTATPAPTPQKANWELWKETFRL